MKEFIKLYIFWIVLANFILSFIYFILIENEIVGFNSFLDFLLSYILFPLSLLLYLLLFYFLIQEKNYGILGKRIMELIQMVIISFLLYLILIRLKIIYAGFVYAFIYAIFPCVLFLYVISISVLLKEKKFKLFKRNFSKFIVWLIILAGGIFLVNLLE